MCQAIELKVFKQSEMHTAHTTDATCVAVE